MVQGISKLYHSASGRTTWSTELSLLRTAGSRRRGKTKRAEAALRKNKLESELLIRCVAVARMPISPSRYANCSCIEQLQVHAWFSGIRPASLASSSVVEATTRRTNHRCSWLSSCCRAIQSVCLEGTMSPSYVSCVM